MFEDILGSKPKTKLNSKRKKEFRSKIKIKRVLNNIKEEYNFLKGVLERNDRDEIKRILNKVVDDKDEVIEIMDEVIERIDLAKKELKNV